MHFYSIITPPPWWGYNNNRKFSASLNVLILKIIIIIKLQCISATSCTYIDRRRIRWQNKADYPRIRALKKTPSIILLMRNNVVIHMPFWILYISICYGYVCRQHDEEVRREKAKKAADKAAQEVLGPVSQ